MIQVRANIFGIADFYVLLNRICGGTKRIRKGTKCHNESICSKSAQYSPLIISSIAKEQKTNKSNRLSNRFCIRITKKINIYLTNYTKIK